MENTLVTK